MRNYALLFNDTRLWSRCCTPLIFTAIALPIELVLGLWMAQLFIDHLPGRQIFIALLVLPVVISPIVAGATWSLMFDNRYGPINQVIGWLARREATLLWTISPQLVYPAILAAEVWQWTPFMFLLLLAALSAVDPLAARGGGHRRRRLLAHVLAHRPARDLAGDGGGDPDPRPRPRSGCSTSCGC